MSKDVKGIARMKDGSTQYILHWYRDKSADVTRDSRQHTHRVSKDEIVKVYPIQQKEKSND